MNANQKKVAINKVLVKDGTSFDEVVRAHQSYFTHLSNYLKKHEGEEKNYEMEIRWGLAETASEFNNKGTMKWLVEFLVGNCDIAKGEREKWLDYAKVVSITDNLKKAKAMVNWDMKYHREAFDRLCALLTK